MGPRHESIFRPNCKKIVLQQNHHESGRRDGVHPIARSALAPKADVPRTARGSIGPNLNRCRPPRSRQLLQAGPARLNLKCQPKCWQVPRLETPLVIGPTPRLVSSRRLSWFVRCQMWMRLSAPTISCSSDSNCCTSPSRQVRAKDGMRSSSGSAALYVIDARAVAEIIAADFRDRNASR